MCNYITKWSQISIYFFILQDISVFIAILKLFFGSNAYSDQAFHVVTGLARKSFSVSDFAILHR